MTLKYTTIVKFNRFLQADEEIPAFVSGSTPSLENVGTGDGSTTVFYFDQNKIIESSETLYTGSTAEAGATTTLTVDTHYTIDEDKGKLTLTSTGVACVASTSIFATYSYNRFGIKNELISEVLHRAEAEVDDSINTVFFDGTAATPDVGVVSSEITEGQGQNNRAYAAWKYPIYDNTTTASGAISASDTTITVTSTNGFPSSGTIAIDNDKISYTGKTTTTFTGCTSVTDDHDDGATVTSFVIERALDDEGNSPNYTTMKYLTDYDIDFDSGEIKINSVSAAGTVLLDNFHPPLGVWNRVRLSYLYGYDNIPNDIERLVHLIAARELYSGQVFNAVSRGVDGFNLDGIDSFSNEIEMIKNRYKCPDIRGLKPQTVY